MMKDPEKTIGNLIDKQTIAFIASVDEEGFPLMKATPSITPWALRTPTTVSCALLLLMGATRISLLRSLIFKSTFCGAPGRSPKQWQRELLVPH